MDPVFDAGPIGGPPGNMCVATQNDGKVIVAGAFTSINEVARGRIARLNDNGSVDGTFLNGLAGADNVVHCVAVQTNGQILIGGAFTQVNGVNRNRIARLNSDGSLDNTFLNGLTGADDWVESIVVQNDGRILIGGYFTFINGVTRNLIARFNADGSLDPTFQNGMAGANNGVFSILIQPDNKAVIGGAFTFVNGLRRNSVARLNSDGSVDESFLNDLTGADGAINSLALQPDGKIIAGGFFTGVNGVGRNRLARLNNDGSLDGTFMAGLAGANNHVYSVGLQADGRLIVGGAFTSLNGFARQRVARLNSDGSVDQWFLYRVEGPDELVGALALQADGKILIGGDFTFVEGLVRRQIARLVIDYGPPQIFDPALQNGQMTFLLYGAPGQTLVVQAGSDNTNWTSIGTNVVGNNNLPSFTDPELPLAEKRFYRLLRP